MSGGELKKRATLVANDVGCYCGSLKGINNVFVNRLSFRDYRFVNFGLDIVQV